MKTRRALVALLVMASAALFPTSAGAATTDTIVATHLDAPRGVAFHHGHLIVAEAGHGGSSCDGVAGAFGTICIGTSARISRVNMATTLPEPMVSGLFSALEWHGPSPEQLGVDGISVRGDDVLGILALAPQVIAGVVCPAAPAGADCREAKRQAGHLISVSGHGWRSVAPVGREDYKYTLQFPEPVRGAPPTAGTQEHDSNPYGVLASPGGAYVADAGSNTLDWVSNSGHVRVLQHFSYPSAGFPSDAVPTCVARTDEALWVADLSGHLFRIEGGSVTKMDAPLLEHVTGCTSDENGNLYFVNMWTKSMFPAPVSGNVVRFKADEGSWSVVNDRPIDFPNMITVGPDGNLYVSADSVCPAFGAPAPFCALGGTVHRLTVASDHNQQDGQH